MTKQTRPIGKHGGKRTVSQHTRADGNTQTANRVGGKFDDKSGVGELSAADAFAVDHDSTMEVGETRTAPPEPVESPRHEEHFDAHDIDFRVAHLASEDHFTASFTRGDDEDGLHTYDYLLTGPADSVEGRIALNPAAVSGTPNATDALWSLVEGAERHAHGEYIGYEDPSSLMESDKAAAASLHRLVGEHRYPLYESGGALENFLEISDAEEAASPLPIGETRALRKSSTPAKGDPFDPGYRADRLIDRDNLTGTVTHDSEGQYTATITGPTGTGTFTLLRPESDGAPDLNDAVTSLVQSANENRYWKAVRPEDQDEFELYARQNDALQEAVGAERLEAYASPYAFKQDAEQRPQR